MTKKSKTLIDAEQRINQLKLMQGKEPNIYYITAVDDKGLLHVKKIKYDFNHNQLEESDYKIYNCGVESSDNSIWSLDCHYPNVIVGGNHKCVMIFNIAEHSESNSPICKNLIYKGNKHNVPYVSFSPNGELITCASIDTQVKSLESKLSWPL